MRYAQIRSIDVSDGEGIGVALFVQGCNFHCYNCFNPETWDFNGGKEFTLNEYDQFLNLIDKPYIKRISFLGGEPLADENLSGEYGIFKIIANIKKYFPEKNIWCYTGYTWEKIFPPIVAYNLNLSQVEMIRQMTVKEVDVLVDGPYIDNLKDINLQFIGSSNQRIIDVKKTLEERNIVLWKQK